MGYAGKRVLKCRISKAKPIRGCQKGSLGQPTETTVKHKAFQDTKKQWLWFKMKHKELFHQIFWLFFTATSFIWLPKKSHAGSLSPSSGCNYSSIHQVSFFSSHSLTLICFSLFHPSPIYLFHSPLKSHQLLDPPQLSGSVLSPFIPSFSCEHSLFELWDRQALPPAQGNDPSAQEPELLFPWISLYISLP